MDIKAIDFFCGGGGMTQGLIQSGVNVLAGVDLDEEAKETYEINNQPSVFVQGDINDLPLNYFEENFAVKKNDDNMIFVGCSPCQFYSIINTDRSRSKQGKDLLMSFAQFVDYYNPGFVLVENVPGILSNPKSILPKFLKFLTKKGYVFDHQIVDLSYYNVPQTRTRYSLIASRVHEDIQLPTKNEERALLKDYIGEQHGFSRIKAGHRDISEFNHTTAGLSDVSLERLALTPKDGGNRLAWKDYPELQLACFIGKDNSFVDTYGRMFWDKPASTITTRFFSVSNGRFAHPEEDRAISLREGATLQTFPKSYIFKTTSIGATARLIGNAVPPEYARLLGEAIKNKITEDNS